MKLFTYRQGNQIFLGTAMGEIAVKAPISPEHLYRYGLDSLSVFDIEVDSDKMTFPMLDLGKIQFAPVVPNPSKIICVGLNYAEHTKESGSDIPKFPVLFTKFKNTLSAHNEKIPIRPEWERVDYEAEVAVVMGKKASRVAEDEALNYVLGYTIANDLTERRIQSRTSQWMLGKSIDKFLPLGPYLITADEIPDPQNLTIKGWLNGELRQDSHTSNMIFSIAKIISYISQTMTLESGDVILTGTPEGVILGFPKEERQWLKAGDEYSIKIESIGTLSNTLIDSDETVN